MQGRIKMRCGGCLLKGFLGKPRALPPAARIDPCVLRGFGIGSEGGRPAGGRRGKQRKKGRYGVSAGRNEATFRRYVEEVGNEGDLGPAGEIFERGPEYDVIDPGPSYCPFSSSGREWQFSES